MDRTHITTAYIIQSPFPELDIPRCDLWSHLLNSIEKYENRIAFMDPVASKSLTYKEVLEKTEIIARNLLAHGFSADKILTICLPNCLDFVLILFSVVRIGAKCGILSAYLKEGEIKPLIRQLNTEFIVTNRKTVDVVKSATTGIEEIKIISDEPGHFLSISDLYTRTEKTDKISLQPPDINPAEDVCLIPFSSGTTGNPKPVQVTHSFLVQQILTYSYALDMETLNNGVLFYQPISHAWTYILMLCHFSNGQRTLIMPEPDMNKFVALVSQYKIERLYMAPPAIVFMCKSGICKKYPLQHITYIQSAAATLSNDLEQELLELLGRHVKMTQMFGANEVGVGLAVPMKEGVQCARGSIGWPVNNTSVKIVDPDTGINLGPHKHGELCIKSPNPMKGYLGSIELTAQAFDSYGYCKTGDLAYYDEKGCVFIIDRLKDVINVGGHKVPPALLESLLLTHPCVADAGVTSVPNEEYVEVPSAWVVKKPGMEVTEDELHIFVNEKVYDRRRLRGGIKFVDAIPKAPSGKILRRMMKEQNRVDIK